MIPFSESTSLFTAAAALDLVTFVVLAFVSVLQFCFVRRHGDAARTWVKWARWSLATLTFTMFVLCADLIIATVYSRFTDRGIEFFESEKKGLSQARGILDSVWWLGEAVVRVLLLATFAMLGAGIAMARSGGAAQPGWTKMPSLAWGAGGLTLVLAVALFGLRCYFWAHIYDAPKSESLYDRSLRNHGGGGPIDFNMINRVTIDMDFTLHCIWLFLSLIVLALAVRTRQLCRSAPHTKTASNYFLACAILFVIQPLYNVIIFIIFDLGLYIVASFGPTIVTDVILRMWPYASILLILFVLGRKKIGGVWSTQQPFQTKDAVAGETVYQTPWGYQVTHSTIPQQVPSQDAQAELNNYYAQPQHNTQPLQHQQHQQQPHYG
ncbi:hypothetical protein NLG97_g5114 [Lecanicillium saksenae]|uniref:Uncharacterized protein n=1 Tax=Lecanicillium saksenae TaxID=468837 RepID=A0ACC1QTC7_9HYPO|nr:hypothetical protein NLG97_g5114 [Lecanicillium saksenae]